MTSEKNKLKFLIVEDNKINQLVIGNKLKSFGHEVHYADNGKIGVELFDQIDFDVILMDLMMPIMDGFEATRIIRASQKGKKIPIIAVTADTLESDRIKCFELGMNGYTNKPLDINKINSVLDELGIQL